MSGTEKFVLFPENSVTMVLPRPCPRLKGPRVILFGQGLSFIRKNINHFFGQGPRKKEASWPTSMTTSGHVPKLNGLLNQVQQRRFAGIIPANDNVQGLDRAEAC
jgi:hypothetical protein